MEDIETIKKILLLLIVMGFIIIVVTARKISNFENVVLVVVLTISLMVGCELI